MSEQRRRSRNLLVYFGLAPDPNGPQRFAWTARTASLFAVQVIVVIAISWVLDGSLSLALGFGLVFTVIMVSLIAIRSRREQP